MTSMEESMLTSEAVKNLTAATTFIGYGTKQIIQNNGWSTVRNTTRMVDSVTQLSTLKPVTLHYFPNEPDTSSLTAPLSLPPVGNSTEASFAGLISVKNLNEMPGKSLPHMFGRSQPTPETAAPLKPLAARYFPDEPAKKSLTVPMDGPANSLTGPTCVPPVGDTSDTTFAGFISVKNVNEVPAEALSSATVRDEPSSVTAAPLPDNDPSVTTAQGRKGSLVSHDNGTVLSQTSGATRETSLSPQIDSSCDSEQADSDLDFQIKNERSKVRHFRGDDMVLSDNNNYKDIVTLENVKTDKAAARLQLNAVLQSEISKTVKAKFAALAKSTAETKPSNFLIGQTGGNAINLSSLPRDATKQNLTGFKANLSQVVRIQNAKIVEVFETENKLLAPAARLQKQATSIGGFVPMGGNTMIPSRYANESLVKVGRLEMAADIFKCPRPPHMVFSSLQCSNVVEAKTDCSIVHPQDFDLLDDAEDGKSFVFDPLCISADTLVPVALTTGHGERQNPDKACLQQNDGTRNSGIEDAAESESTVLRCFLCPFFHSKQSKIAKHWIETHLRQLPYVCTYCDRGFTTSWEVHKHIVRFHPGEKLKVGIKNSVHFASSLAYEVVHSDAADIETAPTGAETVVLSGNDLQTCKKCDFQCETSAELRSHQRSFHFKFKPYFCTYCTDRKLSFVCDFDLKQHIRVHHPERMLSMGRAFHDAILPKLTADINWSSTYETISIANQVMFQCRMCAFRSLLSESAWKHVLLKHLWPETVTCPSCANVFELSGAERDSFSASCSKCQTPVSLGPDVANIKPNDKGEPVYICTICDYKTMGKGSMNRHLKYNHTKCRPYGCVYCNYVAVERPKVKMHIESLHKDQKIAIKERTESSEGFRKLVEDLFSSIVRVGYYSELSDSISAVGLDELNIENEIDIDDVSIGGTRSSRKRPRLSVSLDDDPETTMYPSSLFEADTGLAARDRDRRSFNGEHFKCMICGYVCTDRSCMSRHIKYMHITSRPHSCPYCRYNNVEKTKVRLHVKSHHPNQPKCVKTNKKLLEDMSSEAKKFYVKVDSAGQVVQDSNSSCLLPHMSSDVDQDQTIDMLEGGDSIMNEFILTELDPENDIIDVQTDHCGATVVLREGVYQVGIKEEPTDDVEIKEEPGVRLPRIGDVSLTSNALDHNYVIDCPGAVTDLVSDLSVTVKTEPEDDGYEVDDVKLSPAGSSTSINKKFIDFSSGTSDEDDEDEDESLVEIPLGASAANLDGLDGLDSDEDDLEEDSDLDLLDFADFELDGSNHLDGATKTWKSSEQVVERNRLRLLHQIRMDDGVRDDPKIWMRTLVSVEDIISRISADMPIMDL